MFSWIVSKSTLNVYITNTTVNIRKLSPLSNHASRSRETDKPNQ